MTEDESSGQRPDHDESGGAASRDLPAARSRRSPKLTAAALGTVATLIAAAAGLITALTPWLDDDGGSSVVATAGTVGTGEASEPAAPEHLLLADSLEGGGPLADSDIEGCQQGSTDLGYRIQVQHQFSFCDQLIKATTTVAGQHSVRIEVTAVWTSVPAPVNKHFGAGDATVSCRANGQGGNATAYFAGVTTSGHWEFNRYVHGEQSRLMSGNDAQLASAQGEARRLRLDCIELEDRDIRLDFYVDRALVGTYADPDPIPTGLVGVSAGSYTKQPLTVTFRELRVYGGLA